MVAAAMLAVLVAFTVGVAHLGSAVVARHRAQAAADLAALTGAQRLPGGAARACADAEAVSRRMHATTLQCTVERLDVVVTVAVTPAMSVGGGQAQAAARAGPGR